MQINDMSRETFCTSFSVDVTRYNIYHVQSNMNHEPQIRSIKHSDTICRPLGISTEIGMTRLFTRYSARRKNNRKWIHRNEWWLSFCTEIYSLRQWAKTVEILKALCYMCDDKIIALDYQEITKRLPLRIPTIWIVHTLLCSYCALLLGNLYFCYR